MKLSSCKKCHSANLKLDSYSTYCGACGYIITHKIWRTADIQKLCLSSDENINGHSNMNTV